MKILNVKTIVVATSVLCASLAAAGTQKIDVPAGDLIAALQALEKQAEIDLVYQDAQVKGLKTAGVSGNFSAQEALAKLLAGTNLQVRTDKASGALLITSTETSAPTAKANNIHISATPGSDSRRANAGAGAMQIVGSTENSQSESSKNGAQNNQNEEPKEITVTGSRIRTTLDEAKVQPVFVYTRKDLDRFGVTSVAELRDIIPQLPPTNWNEPVGSMDVGSNTRGQVHFDNGLRGIGNTNTLVLVNGRRVNKLGQGGGQDVYDLAGIPFAAIERIEVLTDGASAVYGADALAGVVNIILKDEYNGTELTMTYGGPFDLAAEKMDAQVVTGFQKGPFSLMLTANGSRDVPMDPQDRWWTSTADLRPFGGPDRRGPVPGGAGSVVLLDPSTAPPGIPIGAFGLPEAAIPAASDGVNLTVQDFINAGPAPALIDGPKDLPQFNDGFTSYAVRMNASYDLKPWMELFAEGSRSLSKGAAHQIPALQFVLPAGYPGNPFGQSILVQREFWELAPFLDPNYENIHYSALMGARGDVGKGWRYEATASRSWVDYQTQVPIGAGYAELDAAVNSPDPAKRPILLNDGTVNSPSRDLLSSLLQSDEGAAENPVLWIYDIKADGPVWTLPAGEVRVAVGAELQQEKSRFPVPSGGPDSPYRPEFGDKSRESVGVFAEMQIPLLGEQQNIPLVYKLTGHLAARHDSYSDFDSRISPRYSLFYYPVPWLGLRGSYGEGYKVPLLNQLYRPVNVGARQIGSSRIVSRNPTVRGIGVGIVDHLRNDQILAAYPFYYPNPELDPVGGGIAAAAAGIPLNFGQLPARLGGNPNLQPEQSESINFGLVFEVPVIDGLSLSVDYYDLKNIDRVASASIMADINTAGMQTLFDYFPERVSRADPTPDEQAAGMAGKVIGLDLTDINVSYKRTKGFDFELRYQKSFTGYGNVYLRATGTKPKISELRVIPTAAISSDIDQNPLRVSSTIAFGRGAWEIGTRFQHTESRVGQTYFTEGNIESVTTFAEAFFFSYDFGRSEAMQGDRWWQRALDGVRINGTIDNIMDKEPVLIRSPGSFTDFKPDGSINPAGRSFSLTIRKSL